MIYLPWTAKARLRRAENEREGVATLSRERINRRELITRGFIMMGAWLLARGRASAQVPMATASRSQRAPVDKARQTGWRTRVRIIEQ